MTSILPPNSTPPERAIESAASFVRDLVVPIRHLWNPQACPAPFLPWLAWSWLVDSWRSNWPEATKRAVIAASPRVHRLKGTVAAVRAAAQAVAGMAPVRVIEWFRPDGSGQPYRSTLDVDVSAGAPAVLPHDLIAAVQGAKPLRSHLNVRLSVRAPAHTMTAALIRRPLITARLTLSGDLRPNISAPTVAVALMRRPLVIATLRGNLS